MNPAVDVIAAVNPALRALLAGTVDYAGLFPPAGLPLAEALENYASYLGCEERWMLGRFVLPTDRMAEAGPCIARRFDPEKILRVSALLPKATNLTNLTTNLRELAHFREKHGPSVSVDQLEAPLPLPLPAGAELCALLGQTADVLESHLPGSLATFWEIPFSDSLPDIMAQIAAFNAETTRSFNVKLRTGGLAATAFPTAMQLADAFVAARDCGIALKFTAGLHHPIRRFDPGVQTKMHGFLNVFAAGILAREHGLDAEHTHAILDDEEPGSFRLTEDGFAWRDLRASPTAIAAHRRFITSFGSCSFDEPRDDLRQLGLLA